MHVRLDRQRTGVLFAHLRPKLPRLGQISISLRPLPCAGIECHALHHVRPCGQSLGTWVRLPELGVGLLHLVVLARQQPLLALGQTSLLRCLLLLRRMIQLLEQLFLNRTRCLATGLELKAREDGLQVLVGLD